MAHPDPAGPRQAGPAYASTLSESEAERIRRWHHSAYEAASAEAASTRTFTYLGTTLVIPPQVHPVTGMSHLLGEAVLAEVRDDDHVLDMGTGSGVNAILAASAAARVLAVDINPVAVETARGNAARNGVEGRVEVRHSDVFGNVEGRFDLIVFDPPFRWFAPRDLLEAAMTDENYQAMTTFFRNARSHLSPGGRMLISFGTSGDLAYLRRLAGEEGFVTRTVAQRSLVKDGWTVDYFVFRMLQAP
ncbi:release factor glutamine methyltransferase [Nonomuraea thailandensis]|uniref:Release factor glutamine methyltransferase n=1 Tax=Nonomuraea thailandensis TaxID=1188745 RepID=A0A9X2K1S8_9ACTN|nr:methyltransferase [Nonomuraea thailandensis]MCP2357278.1 release factor glutamine methyltransferase [Nonomuraea thailandensis]